MSSSLWQPFWKVCYHDSLQFLSIKINISFIHSSLTLVSRHLIIFVALLCILSRIFFLYCGDRPPHSIPKVASLVSAIMDFILTNKSVEVVGTFESSYDHVIVGFTINAGKGN